MASEAGKGSAPRKQQDHKSYGENHSKIFGPSKLEQKLQQEREKHDTIQPTLKGN